jgi:hypothetical protein
MSNQIYYAKYLKYKNKYISFKKYHDGTYIDFNKQLSSKDINDLHYTNREIDCVNKNIKYLLHKTTPINFKKIIKDMELKSTIYTYDKDRKKNSWYDYLVFLSLVPYYDQNFYSTWSNLGEKNIGLVFSNDLLFDNDAYYFFAASGEMGEYHYDAIPNHNIKKILYQDDMASYVNKLSVSKNIKDGLLEYIEDDYNSDIFKKRTKNVSLCAIDVEDPHPMHEFCFFDKVDLKKYLVGIIFYNNNNNYKKFKNLIPKNVFIQKNKPLPY